MVLVKNTTVHILTNTIIIRKNCKIVKLFEEPWRNFFSKKLLQGLFGPVLLMSFVEKTNCITNYK